MVIPIIGLVILVVFISNSASNVTTEDRYRIYKSRRIWSCETFNISLSIHGFYELKLHIYASYVGDNCVCFSLIRKKMNQTQDRFLIC